MDIELLRTFLEVHRTRHFGRAASNLHLTQSAVSARVRLLETHVGVALFSRERNNIRLTAAGQRLLVHAEAIVHAWNRARQQIEARDEARAVISVSAEPVLWDTVLTPWLLRHYGPGIDLQIDATAVDTQLRRLHDGTLDLAFQQDPPGLDSLLIEPFARLRLVLVATRAGIDAREAMSEGYILVDWGPAFARSHACSFEDIPAPGIRVPAGGLARSLLLASGGAAYLAEPSVEADLGTGRLHRVAGAPVIERPVYAVFAADNPRAQRVRSLLCVSAADAPDGTAGS